MTPSPEVTRQARQVMTIRVVRFVVVLSAALIAGQVATKAIANLAAYNHANAAYPHY